MKVVPTYRLPLLVAGALAAVLVFSDCARPGAPAVRGREPELRVAIVVGSPGVRVGGQGPVSVRGSGEFTIDAGDNVRVTSAGSDEVRVEDRSGSRAGKLEFRSRNRSEFVTVNGRPYRGMVEVYSGDGGVIAVNVVGMEAYLRGVVTVEMGPRTRNEMAALEAQAMVSRTYAMKNRGRFTADGYDIRASVSDQAYLGVDRESSEGNDAVAGTAGLVVTHRGQPASVFFHSTCGYSTASPDEAFRSVQSVAYLKPVSDRRPSGGYYCDMSPRFRWTVEWEGSELRDILRRTLPAVLGVDESAVDEVRYVYSHGTGPSRRVTELRVRVGSGEIPVFGPDVRRVLETPEGRPLGSTAIEVSATSEAGAVDRLEVSGAGWGHGVGMCQWGTIGRARAGHSAHTIVTTYFPGTQIERWY
jgi:stage II sporulation protein D